MKKGFTLVELLVAISIIAILSTIGLITFSGIQSKARDSARKNNLRTLATALEIYFQKNSHYVSGYGTKCIKDPNNPQANDTEVFDNNIRPLMSGENIPIASYCYTGDPTGISFRLFTKLENCKSDPDVIPGVNCGTAKYNYSLVSDNLTLALAPDDGGLSGGGGGGGSGGGGPVGAATCKDGKTAQVYTDKMVGCNGPPFPTYDKASELCGAGSRVCSVTEYITKGGGSTAANVTFRWLYDYSLSAKSCDSPREAFWPTRTPAGAAFVASSQDYSTNYLYECSQYPGYYRTYPVSTTVQGTTCCAGQSPQALPAAPTLTASCSVNPTSPILSDSVTWTASSQFGQEPLTYQWSGSDNLNGWREQTMTFKYPAPGTKTGQVTVKDQSGATATSPVCSVNIPAPADTAACTGGTDEQTWSSDMVGCNSPDPVFYSNIASMCGPQWHVCSLTEYLARGGDHIKDNKGNGTEHWLVTPGTAGGNCTSTRKYYKIGTAESTNAFVTTAGDLNNLDDCSQNYGYYMLQPKTNSYAGGAMCCK